MPEATFIGFLAWVARGLAELSCTIWDIDTFLKCYRFPGTVIVECTVRTNRYSDEPATAAEYVVATLFWVGLLFGVYLLVT